MNQVIQCDYSGIIELYFYKGANTHFTLVDANTGNSYKIDNNDIQGRVVLFVEKSTTFQVLNNELKNFKFTKLYDVDNLSVVPMCSIHESLNPVPTSTIAIGDTSIMFYASPTLYSFEVPKGAILIVMSDPSNILRYSDITIKGSGVKIIPLTTGVVASIQSLGCGFISLHTMELCDDGIQL